MVGYFSVYDLKQKRAFKVTDPLKLPKDINIYSIYPITCKLETLQVVPPLPIPLGSGPGLDPDIITPVRYTPNGRHVISKILVRTNVGDTYRMGYTLADADCADCRLSGGGTTVRPDYWQQDGE